MIFRTEVTSNAYLDDAPEFNVSYSTEDVLDFTDYVNALISHIEGLMRFDSFYRDVVEIRVRIIIHGQRVATECFRRESDNPSKILRVRTS